MTSTHQAPKFEYKGPDPSKKGYNNAVVDGNDVSNDSFFFPPLDGPLAMDLGNYRRQNVTNVDSDDVNNKGRAYFDLGLRHMLCYQHEMAAKCFLACLHFAPHCALAHGFVALCHAPNYNFKADAYYNSSDHPEDEGLLYCIFPSQQFADRHSKLAIDKVEELRRLHRNTSKGSSTGSGHKKKKKKNGHRNKQQQHSPNDDSTEQQQQQQQLPKLITDLEAQLLLAIRKLTCQPGVDATLSDEAVGRPYADAMRKLYVKYPKDAEVAYCFAESLMVLNAWQLYEYPTGRPLSPDVEETRTVLETVLQQHDKHPGLCHMYVHLSEMSADPGKALQYCQPLRSNCPHAGHLIHMPTHIDTLVGDYESVVRWNYAAILADEHAFKASPDTAGTISFYFGYIVHNYHMLVYGAILGGMEKKAMEIAHRLNTYLNEDMFAENPDLVAYLESYSALEIHVLVRFGRWQDILLIVPPKDKHLMLFRAATLKFARALAFANLGNVEEAKKEADRYDAIRNDPEAEVRILHNNQVSDLLAVDAPMVRGEIAYREGKYEEAFRLLRKAVELQDGLNFDEPWGKMQPIRHALGGLLLEQNQIKEAEEVFRTDLRFHPKNPWGLVGLFQCLKQKLNKSPGHSCCASENSHGGATIDGIASEIEELQILLDTQRKSEWADFDITVACACCQKVSEEVANGN